MMDTAMKDRTCILRYCIIKMSSYQVRDIYDEEGYGCTFITNNERFLEPYVHI